MKLSDIAPAKAVANEYFDQLEMLRNKRISLRTELSFVERQITAIESVLDDFVEEIKKRESTLSA